MKVSIDELILLVVQYLEEDNEPMSEAKILVLPCKDEKTADEFEEFYRKKFSDTQLMAINRTKSPIYG